MEQTRKGGKTTGPIRGAKSAGTVKTTVMLDPDDAAWGKGQPGGLSATIRRLLARERGAARGREAS